MKSRGSKRKIKALCCVMVIAPGHKHRHGPGSEVHISLTIPPHEEILVNRTTPDDARHEHVEVAIKDAFSSARRQPDSLSSRGERRHTRKPIEFGEACS